VSSTTREYLQHARPARVEAACSDYPRHPFGHSLAASGPQHRLTQLMGHHSLDTTLLYIRGTSSALQRDVEPIAWAWRKNAEAHTMGKLMRKLGATLTLGLLIYIALFAVVGAVLNALGSLYLPRIILAFGEGLGVLALILGLLAATVDALRTAVWKNANKLISIIAAVLLVVVTVIHFLVPPLPQHFVNLEDQVADWHVFVTGTTAQYKLETESTICLLTQSCPSLKVSLLGGAPYVRVLAYRDVLSDQPNTVSATSSVTLDLWFLFPSVPAPRDAIHTLKFTLDRSDSRVATRSEWALQWENIEARAAGLTPTWRIWTGTDWQATNVQQDLAADSWHHLQLSGSISDGQVHYTSFSCDLIRKNLDTDHLTFPPVPSSDPTKITVGVELEANQTATPYHVYLDQVALNLG
jgi:hypothetical protein